MTAGEMKHTAGPWEWRNVSGAGLQIFGNPGKRDFVEWSTTGEGPVRFFELLPDSPKFTIAYERWVQFTRKDWDEMQEANARLIAAAPDLLEALSLVMGLWDNDQIVPFNPSTIDLRPIFKARASIAKATP